MIDHLKIAAIWATVPARILATLIIGTIDPLPRFDARELERTPGAKPGPLTSVSFGAVRLDIAVVFSAFVFGITRTNAPGMRPHSDN